MTDRDLLQKYVRTRDDAAFRELVRRHGGMVRGVAMRLSRDDVDDITQAVFLLLSRKAASLTKHINLAGWLYKTARLCARNAVRARLRREKHLRRAQEAAMNATADEQVNHAELREMLDAGLSKLSKPYRQAVLVRYLEGQTLEEAAGQLGVTTDALAKRCQRGLDKLRLFFSSRGKDAAPAIVTAALESQVHHLSEIQMLDVTQSISPTAASLAKATALGMAVAELKIVALIVLGLSGAAAAVVAVASKPPAAPVPVAVVANSPVPATAPALTSDGAKLFATQYFTALRDRDRDRLAGMVAGRSLAEKLATADRQIAEFRDGPYAKMPKRLTTIVGTSVSQSQAGKFLSGTFDASPPTVADVQRLSIRIQPVSGNWLVQQATYTSSEAISANAEVVIPATGPAVAAPPGTYAKALRIYREMQTRLDVDMEKRLSPEQKPKMLEMLTALQGDVRKLAEALEPTDLAIPAPTCDKVIAMTARLHDALEKDGIDAFMTESKRLETAEGREFNIIYGLGEKISSRADAEADATRTKARPPAFSPSIPLVASWDQSKHEVPGALMVPPWLRESESFRLWQMRHNVQTFRTTDDAGNRYEVFCLGASVEQDGVTREMIPQIRQLRADGTLAATAHLGSRGEPYDWATLDASGLRYTMRATTTERDGPQQLREVQFFKPDGSAIQWDIDATGTITNERINDPAGELVKFTRVQMRRPATTRRASAQ